MPHLRTGLEVETKILPKVHALLLNFRNKWNYC